jgi:hypothetical protein
VLKPTAEQLGHLVETFHKIYTTWIDGDQHEAEIAKFEANLKPLPSLGGQGSALQTAT